MADDLNTEIKIGADASGVEAGVGRAKRSLKSLGDAAQQAGKDAGAGMGAIGAGSDKSAKDVERATRTMQNSIQRLIAEQKAGAKGSREYWEALANTRGVNTAALRPLLDQLDAAKSATNAAKGAAESWRDSLGKIGPMVAAAFSGAALAGFIGKVVSVQREFDVLNSSLKTVTGSSAAAEREMAWLKDFAKETPFGLAQATQGFVKMKALGLDPTRAALTSFGNTASAMGKDLNQMIEAVADASTGEFERLKEFGIKAKKEGDQVSLTFQGVTTTIGNSAREITQYLENIGNTSFGGAMEERAKTLDGTIAALGDTWDELFRTVSTNNVGSLIFDSVTLANGALEDATTILRAMGGAAQDASRDTGALSTIQNGIATVFETVAVLGANLKFVLVGIGTEIGGLAAQVAQAAQFNFAGVRAIREQMVADAEAARREIDATTERILNARKAQEEYARWSTRNASAATDPRRIDLGGPASNGGGTGKPGKPKKEELSDYDKLIQKLGQEIPKAAAEAEAAQMGYNKAQTEFLALAASPAWAKFTNDQRATVAALFENKIASEQSAEAAKTLAKANLDAAASREKYIASLATGLDKIQADIAAQIEATERMGLSKEAIADLDAAKLEMMATDLELQAIKAMDRNLDEQTYDALKQQAQAYRDLAKAKQEGAAKEVAVDAAKKAADEWQRTSEQINSSLTDALMRGFESGKDFAKNLRDTVVNMFKTMVLRPVISAVLSPVSGMVNGMVQGGMNAVGIGGSSNLLGMANTVSSLNTLYGTASQALYGGVAGASAASLGYANAVGLVGGDAIGALAAANGMWAGVATGAQAAAQSAIAANLALEAGTAAALPAGTISAATGGAAASGGISGALSSIPGWGWALAGIGALFGGDIINGLFGRKLKDQGIEGTLGGEAGFEGQQYRFYKGGLFRSDKTTYSAVDPELARMLAGGFSAVQDQVTDFAEALSLPTDRIKGFTTDIKVSFKGLDEAGIQKALQDALATGSNELAQQVLGTLTTTTREVTETLAGGMGDWGDGTMQTVTRTIEETTYAASEYARDGEKAIDTLTRLATSLGTVNTIWDKLGNTLLDASLAGADAASRIADAFGGLEAMAATTGTYFQNFYSAEEQREAMRRQLEQQFGKLNLTLPDIDAANAREQYRLLAEAQDRSTDEGLKAYAMLLQLSGAFASITQSAEQARESSINAVFGALQRAVKREQEWLQARIDVASEARAALSSLFDLLHDSVQDLYGSVSSTAVQQGAQASAYIAQALATARGTGYLPETDALSDAISAARGGIDATQYATQFEADRARLVLAGQLSELEGMAGEQLGTAERTLRELQGQSEQLDATLQYWRDQLELSQAGVDATLSVADAVAALQALMFPELGKPEDTKPGGAPTFSSGPGGGGGGGGASGPAPSRTDQILGFVDSTYKDTSVLDDLRGFAITAQIKGWTQADIASAYGYSPEDIEKVFSGAGIPKFAVGTNYVPRDMLAQIHEGEAIIPKAYNPWANGQVMQGGDPELLAELRALRAEVAQLRATSAATASYTAQLADQIDNVSGGGNAVRMEAVA